MRSWRGQGDGGHSHGVGSRVFTFGVPADGVDRPVDSPRALAVAALMMSRAVGWGRGLREGLPQEDGGGRMATVAVLVAVVLAVFPRS